MLRCGSFWWFVLPLTKPVKARESRITRKEPEPGKGWMAKQGKERFRNCGRDPTLPCGIGEGVCKLVKSIAGMAFGPAESAEPGTALMKLLQDSQTFA